MPTKRAVLAELTRAEVRAGLDHYELAVDDRRVKAQLVDALARFRKARLDEMLLRLARNRLKELCRVFGLDDAGRRKLDLVARLVGPSAASSGPESPNVASGDDDGIAPPADSRPAAEAPEPPADVLSVAKLEQYLWSAADILRGSIDSSDYKTYIFGLLFLKRLSDRFEEEAEKLIAEGVPEDVAWTDPDEHQFFVPDRARWGAIQMRATNIGEALNQACAALGEQTGDRPCVQPGTVRSESVAVRAVAALPDPGFTDWHRRIGRTTATPAIAPRGRSTTMSSIGSTVTPATANAPPEVERTRCASGTSKASSRRERRPCRRSHQRRFTFLMRV